MEPPSSSIMSGIPSPLVSANGYLVGPEVRVVATRKKSAVIGAGHTERQACQEGRSPK
jgi:hypothetical protein